MSSTWELKEKSTGELTTTVEGDTWKDARKKAFRKLVKKVNLPGFCSGQAPEKLVRKQVSSQNILMEAIDEVIGGVLGTGIKEHDLWVISRSALDIESIDEGKVTFRFNVTVKPEVKLGVYKGLDITKEAVEVSDADVEEKITRLQGRFVGLTAKEEGKVENGDTAVTGSEGFKKSAAFEDGEGGVCPLMIESGSFIPGFKEQVLGMGIGETKGTNVAFPGDYQTEELAGRPVAFKVTIHEIKSKMLPEADDELIEQARIENVETLEAFKEYFRKNLEESKKNQAEQKSENEILIAVTENAEAEIPQTMVEEETDNLVRDFEQRLQSRGFDLEQLRQVTGQTDEMIREEMGKDAFNKVEVRLVLEAIAVGEKVEINEEDVDNKLENIANMYQMPIEQIEQLISSDAVSYGLHIRKALELVKEATGK